MKHMTPLRSPLTPEDAMPMFRPLVRFAPLMLLAGAIGCDSAAPPAGAVRPATPPAQVADAHADHGHADHDHDHDEPTSFADGVAKLKSLGEDLADKLANNAGEAADDTVHDIGHLLEAVREHATKAGLTDAEVAGLDRLLDLTDNDLLDLLLRRREPEPELESADVKRVLEMLRT
jgi:hypothetical protein